MAATAGLGHSRVKVSNTTPPCSPPHPNHPPAHPQINGSLARAAIKELLSQGLIKQVAHSNAQQIYTRATAAAS